jgi:hypothetical protein
VRNTFQRPHVYKGVGTIPRRRSTPGVGHDVDDRSERVARVAGEADDRCIVWKAGRT